jgi:hypothetical protein
MFNIIVCNTSFFECKLINSSLNYLDYYKLVYVFFKSIINNNTDNINNFNFYFVTDCIPNDDLFVDKINKLNINIIIKKYTYLPNFIDNYNDKQKWLNSFYKFDCFDFIKTLEGISMFCDTDVMCINKINLNNIEEDIRNSEHVLNMTTWINNERKWIMGEIFIGNTNHWIELTNKIYDIYTEAIKLNIYDLENKFVLLDNSKPFFTNDETLLTIIFNENNMINNKAEKYIKRIWDHDVENKNYEETIKNISFLHIPQQKNTMLKLYQYCLI